MKYLMSLCLIIVGFSLIRCNGVVQPQEAVQPQEVVQPINNAVSPPQAPAQTVNNGVSPLQTPTELNKQVMATSNKVIIPVAETTVVHTNIKGESVTVMVGSQTPTPILTPRWVDDNLVVLETSWPNVIELKVGQQIAIMPQPRRMYEWKLKYDTDVLELMEDVTQSKVPEAGWIWTAKKSGETTLRLSSGPPPCEEQLTYCSLAPIKSLTVNVKVIP